MKKIQLIILALFILNKSLDGQIMIGIVGGINNSKVYDRKISDPHYSGGNYNSYNSYVFEINYIKRSKNLIKYGMTFSYLTREFAMHSSVEGLAFYKIIDARYNLSYISFSFLPEISYGNKFRFFFNLGPSIDILINGSQKGENYLIMTVPIQEGHGTRTDYKLTDTFNDLLFGIKTGVGLDYQLSTKIVFKLKTNISTEISDFSGKETSNFFSMNCVNFGFQAGFNYLFIK